MKSTFLAILLLFAFANSLQAKESIEFKLSDNELDRKSDFNNA